MWWKRIDPVSLITIIMILQLMVLVVIACRI